MISAFIRTDWYTFRRFLTGLLRIRTTVVKAGDIVKVKVMEVDLPRKRIALTMRLDEQPGDSNARRGGGQERPQGNRPAAKAAKPRGREAQPAGNSAMMDALAAAMGKKR
ncbi:transcription accessory protein [Klebsiella pneumoniae]|uniref:Transcription accessory protein n=1 Tax=Klebsiella pneumoniae TaxID=573 RepID=A0A447RW79_KLEPN|nr:transcription accessory protein [Klebsiella pneumoniae]